MRRNKADLTSKWEISGISRIFPEHQKVLAAVAPQLMVQTLSSTISRFPSLESVAGALRSIKVMVDGRAIAGGFAITIKRSLPSKHRVHRGAARILQLPSGLSSTCRGNRGQISLMMRQLKAEPVATDFHAFLAEDK
jgi:hypothetical protein